MFQSNGSDEKLEIGCIVKQQKNIIRDREFEEEEKNVEKEEMGKEAQRSWEWKFTSRSSNGYGVCVCVYAILWLTNMQCHIVIWAITNVYLSNRKK